MQKIRHSDMSPAPTQANARRVGKRGVVVIPAPLRRRYGLEEGSLVVAEAREDGILLRSVIATPVEVYTPERRAEFLLSNAVDDQDYERSVAEVWAMGIDPEAVAHRRPAE